jgi:hypothetical protein
MKLKLNHADNITLVVYCVTVRKNLQSALNKNKYNLSLIANTDDLHKACKTFAYIDYSVILRGEQTLSLYMYVLCKYVNVVSM